MFCKYKPWLRKQNPQTCVFPCSFYSEEGKQTGTVSQKSTHNGVRQYNILMYLTHLFSLCRHPLYWHWNSEGSSTIKHIYCIILFFRVCVCVCVPCECFLLIYGSFLEQETEDLISVKSSHQTVLASYYFLSLTKQPFPTFSHIGVLCFLLNKFIAERKRSWQVALAVSSCDWLSSP